MGKASRTKGEKYHLHFCPRCGRAVVCGTKYRGIDCCYLKNGEPCVDCGGTWQRPEKSNG